MDQIYKRGFVIIFQHSFADFSKNPWINVYSRFCSIINREKYSSVDFFIRSRFIRCARFACLVNGYFVSTRKNCEYVQFCYNLYVPSLIYGTLFSKKKKLFYLEVTTSTLCSPLFCQVSEFCVWYLHKNNFGW